MSLMTTVKDHIGKVSTTYSVRLYSHKIGRRRKFFYILIHVIDRGTKKNLQYMLIYCVSLIKR